MPTTHNVIARIACRSSFTLRDPGVDDRGDHERDDADRLHHDQGRETEARELEDDGEAEQEGADHPARTLEQAQELRRRCRPAFAPEP